MLFLVVLEVLDFGGGKPSQTAKQVTLTWGRWAGSETPPLGAPGTPPDKGAKRFLGSV